MTQIIQQINNRTDDVIDHGVALNAGRGGFASRHLPSFAQLLLAYLRQQTFSPTKHHPRLLTGKESTATDLDCFAYTEFACEALLHNALTRVYFIAVQKI